MQWHRYAQGEVNRPITNCVIEEIHMACYPTENTQLSSQIQSIHVPPPSWNATGLKTHSSAWAVWSAGVRMQPVVIRSKVSHSEEQETEIVIALMLMVWTHTVAHKKSSGNLSWLIQLYQSRLIFTNLRNYTCNLLQFHLKWRLGKIEQTTFIPFQAN